MSAQTVALVGAAVGAKQGPPSGWLWLWLALVVSCEGPFGRGPVAVGPARFIFDAPGDRLLYVNSAAEHVLRTNSVCCFVHRSCTYPFTTPILYCTMSGPPEYKGRPPLPRCTIRPPLRRLRRRQQGRSSFCRLLRIARTSAPLMATVNRAGHVLSLKNRFALRRQRHSSHSSLVRLCSLHNRWSLCMKQPLMSLLCAPSMTNGVRS